MRIKSLLSPLLIATIALIGLLIFLNLPTQTEQAESTGGNGGVTPVIVNKVEMTEFPVVVEALGTVKANEAVQLRPQQSGVVDAIYFDDGDIVSKGKLLLTLNDREEKARVNELEINIEEAKRQLKRVANLAKTSVASEQMLDETQARVKALDAQLEVANARLAELELRAPFDGKLGIRQVSVGAFVETSDMIATLDDLRRVKVDFSIAESHLPSIAIDQSIQAKSIAYPDEVFNGVIGGIDSRVDPVTRSIQVRAIIDNPNLKLRPGMLMQINLQKRILESLVVPEKALIPNDDKQFVFVVENGKAIQKEVIAGLRRPGIVQIVSGLSQGELVVVEGTLRLRDGSAVSILDDLNN